jgi:hypothetical protein
MRLSISSAQSIWDAFEWERRVDVQPGQATLPSNLKHPSPPTCCAETGTEIVAKTVAKKAGINMSVWSCRDMS